MYVCHSDTRPSDWLRHQHSHVAIAQVEGYLKEAVKSGFDVRKDNLDADPDSEDGSSDQRGAAGTSEEDDAVLDEQTTPPDSFLIQDESFSQDTILDSMAQESKLPFELPDFGYRTGNTFVDDQLVDLGMSELLPPSEVIEEL